MSPRLTAPLDAASVAGRRLLVKHPWVYWLVVGVAALGTAASVLARSDAIEAERAAWGEAVTVFVADRSLAPGDPLAVTAVEVPRAMIPPDALTRPDASTVRRHVGEGEIVVAADVAATSAPHALIPPGWLGVPVVESPASGAAVGDRVMLVSDGIVISGDAIVAGHHDDVTIVAVPEAVAPAVPAAADAQRLTLLLVP